MDHETTRTVLVTVPAAKVVGAVDSIEEPLKVDALDVYNLARGNHLLHLPVDGVVPVVEEDWVCVSGLADNGDGSYGLSLTLHAPVGLLDGAEDTLALGDVAGMSA